MPACPGAGRVGHEIGVEAEGVLLDVDEARPRSLVEEAVGRGHEAERRRDDLVALADLEGSDGHVEPGRPAAAGHPEASSRNPGDRLLELPREGAEGEDTALQDLRHQLAFAGADRRLGQRDQSSRGRVGNVPRVRRSAHLVGTSIVEGSRHRAASWLTIRRRPITQIDRRSSDDCASSVPASVGTTLGVRLAGRQRTGCSAGDGSGSGASAIRGYSGRGAVPRSDLNVPDDRVMPGGST